MNPQNLIELRYQHAAKLASEHTSRGQREDSRTIVDLLDRIDFYQDEVERLGAELAAARTQHERQGDK